MKFNKGSQIFYRDLYEQLYREGYHTGEQFAGKRLIDFLANNYKFKESDKVLDIGCSNGLGIEYLYGVSNDITCYGFDPAEKAIEICKIRDKFYSTSRYKIGALPDIPFDDNMFDVIFCSDVIEHLLPEDSETSIQDIKRVTKDSANIFMNIALVPESGRRKNWDKIMETYDIDGLHTNLKSSDEWIQLFEDNNLKINKKDIYTEPRHKVIVDRQGQKIDISNKESSVMFHLTKS